MEGANVWDEAAHGVRVFFGFDFETMPSLKAGFRRMNPIPGGLIIGGLCVIICEELVPNTDEGE